MQSDAGIALFLLLLSSPPFVLLYFVRHQNLSAWPSALTKSIIFPAVPLTALLVVKVARFFVGFEAGGPMLLILLAAPLFFLAGLLKSVEATIKASSKVRGYGFVALIMNVLYCGLLVLYFVNFKM